MLIVTIRTDRPEAEIGLFDNDRQLAYETWTAYRQLSATIHTKIRDVLASQHKQFGDIQGVVCFKGPGSFTGLRIGAAVGNALAYSLDIPIKGMTGDDWVKEGIMALAQDTSDMQVVPEYGRGAHITTPKK